MKTLANAPIVEALAQISYESGKPVDDATLASCIKQFSGFAIEEINQIQIAPNSAPVIQKYGFKMSSPTKGEVIQVTRDFFAFSRTAKYKDWPEFRAQIKENLAKFLAFGHVTNVNRLALRYINRAPIPPSFKSPKEFLRVYPELAGFAENKPETLILQLTMPISPIEGRANVAVRLDRSAEDSWIVVVDIDVFMTGKFKPSVDDLLSEFDRIRVQKNDIFRKSFTDDAIKTFDM